MIEEKSPKKKMVGYLVYTFAAGLAIAVGYLLFSPSESPEADAESQLNSSLPDGESDGLPEDKVSAYEDLARYNEAQIRGLGADELNVDLTTLADSVQGTQGHSAARGRGVSSDSGVADAVASARSAAKTLQAGRDRSDKPAARATPAGHPPTPEQLERKAEAARRQQALDELRARNEQAQQAALQMIQGQREEPVVAGRPADNSEAAEKEAVSVIPDNQGDIATTLGGGRRRSGGFYGISSAPAQRNSVKACIYGEQTVSEGQHLRIRLLEPVMVSGVVVPAGSILVGTCKIGSDRLLTSVTSIEHDGVIMRVSLEVYDNDGQQGLYVPNSMELEAGREIGADIASSVGSTAAAQTSMFSQQSAAEQIKADVGRGVVQGTFRFIGKKLQVVKVQVQDRHKVFLVPQR
ncbi:MAG: conjugative transposon protein TraM [Prevotellaceae bacterium]|jgi:conjugative transposon TraM protein|nr:conjugative transposon protein TraM [Prevotellaceae bacterium]